MDAAKILRAMPIALALCGLGILAAWAHLGPGKDLQVRVPDMDRPAGAAAGKETVLKGELRLSDGKPSDLPGSWPWFRGAQRDGIYHEDVPLARKWPAAGPRRLWSAELGEGYAGPAIFAGRVYLLDYDRQGAADVVRCLSLDDGKEIWQFRYPVQVKRNHGMSRTVPAVTDKFLVTLGPKCQVACLDPISGQCHWMLDLVRQYRASVPQWYAGQCPLIDGERVILAPGGDALVMAVDAKTGSVIWKSPNPHGWTMTHVSIVPMEFAGRKMYVYCGKGGVAGVSAEDGKILWETTDWKIAIATVPSPVVLPEGKIFFCGGYNAGGLLMQLKAKGEQLVPVTLKRLKASEFGATQHTPILRDGRLYGIREKDKQFVCLDLQGKVVWASGSQQRFGLGPYLMAGSLTYLLDDSGKLTLADADAKGFRPLAAAQVLDGHDAWAPMAMVGGRLLVRDFTRMVCLDVTANAR